MGLSRAQHGRGTFRIVLEVISGPHRGAAFEFQRHDTFLVGRGSWSHLCLKDDLHFSRHHFRIEIRPPDCYLIDLGSRNGTFVNGNRVSAAFLRDGDIVSGGTTKIRVSVREDEASLSTPTVLAGLASTATHSPNRSDRAPAGDAGGGLPGYEIQGELGRGSMGVVYRAVHVATAKPVAIKMLDPGRSASEHAVQLFIREASLLGRLMHPHIVRCLDFGISGGNLFMVMEYVETVPLEDVLEGQSRKTRTRISCAIACQLLRALRHAHHQSIVHRDIKPENVLLWRRGRKLNAKLADFGLAKNYEYAGLSQISREGDIRGTIAYMPPELIVDCRDARPAGDLYSVGATLYFYLTGEFPYEFGSRNKLAVVLEDEPVPLGKRLPEIPPRLAEIVHRSLAKSPADRFPSAARMLEALAPFSVRRKKRS
jgi:serine/threonine-protein kinase